MARVVKFREFLSLPNGTVYSATVRGGIIPAGLSVKIDTLEDDADRPSDFIYRDLLAVGKEVGPDHIPVVGNTTRRWGLFDEGDEFIVYEKSDLTYMGTELCVALGRMVP